MPHTDEFKIHRFTSNTIHDVNCSEESCQWPPHRISVNHNIGDAMEHVGATGHRVRLMITDRYELMPTDAEVIAPTLSEIVQNRDLDPHQEQTRSIDDYVQHTRWTAQMEQLMLHSNTETAQREAHRIMLEIARAAGLERLADICERVAMYENEPRPEHPPPRKEDEHEDSKHAAPRWGNQGPRIDG